MKSKTTYISEDGYEFRTEQECKDYENSDLFEIRKIYKGLYISPGFLSWSEGHVKENDFIFATGFVLLKKNYFGGGCTEFIGKINNKVFIFDSYNGKVKKDSLEFLE